MLLDTKPKTTGVTEVLSQQFILLDFQPTLKKLHCLVTPHSYVAGNLFITSDTERPHSIPCYKNKVKLNSINKLQIFQSQTNHNHSTSSKNGLSNCFKPNAHVTTFLTTKHIQTIEAINQFRARSNSNISRSI